MNTTRPTWATDLAERARHRPTAAVCGCGQDLDVCTGTHCPRCGMTLHHAPFAAAA